MAAPFTAVKSEIKEEDSFCLYEEARRSLRIKEELVCNPLLNLRHVLHWPSGEHHPEDDDAEDCDVKEDFDVSEDSKDVGINEDSKDFEDGCLRPSGHSGGTNRCHQMPVLGARSGVVRGKSGMKQCTKCERHMPYWDNHVHCIACRECSRANPCNVVCIAWSDYKWNMVANELEVAQAEAAQAAAAQVEAAPPVNWSVPSSSHQQLKSLGRVDQPSVAVNGPTPVVSVQNGSSNSVSRPGAPAGIRIRSLEQINRLSQAELDLGPQHQWPLASQLPFLAPGPSTSSAYGPATTNGPSRANQSFPKIRIVSVASAAPDGRHQPPHGPADQGPSFTRPPRMPATTIPSVVNVDGWTVSAGGPPVSTPPPPVSVQRPPHWPQHNGFPLPRPSPTANRPMPGPPRPLMRIPIRPAQSVAALQALTRGHSFQHVGTPTFAGPFRPFFPPGGPAQNAGPRQQNGAPFQLSFRHPPPPYPRNEPEAYAPRPNAPVSVRPPGAQPPTPTTSAPRFTVLRPPELPPSQPVGPPMTRSIPATLEDKARSEQEAEDQRKLVEKGVIVREEMEVMVQSMIHPTTTPARKSTSPVGGESSSSGRSSTEGNATDKPGSSSKKRKIDTNQDRKRVARASDDVVLSSRARGSETRMKMVLSDDTRRTDPKHTVPIRERLARDLVPRPVLKMGATSSLAGSLSTLASTSAVPGTGTASGRSVPRFGTPDSTRNMAIRTGGVPKVPMTYSKSDITEHGYASKAKNVRGANGAGPKISKTLPVLPPSKKKKTPKTPSVVTIADSSDDGDEEDGPHHVSMEVEESRPASPSPSSSDSSSSDSDSSSSSSGSGSSSTDEEEDTPDQLPSSKQEAFEKLRFNAKNGVASFLRDAAPLRLKRRRSSDHASGRKTARGGNSGRVSRNSLASNRSKRGGDTSDSDDEIVRPKRRRRSVLDDDSQEEEPVVQQENEHDKRDDVCVPERVQPSSEIDKIVTSLECTPVALEALAKSSFWQPLVSLIDVGKQNKPRGTGAASGKKKGSSPARGGSQQSRSRSGAGGHVTATATSTPVPGTSGRSSRASRTSSQRPESRTDRVVTPVPGVVWTQQSARVKREVSPVASTSRGTGSGTKKGKNTTQAPSTSAAAAGAGAGSSRLSRSQCGSRRERMTANSTGRSGGSIEGIRRAVLSDQLDALEERVRDVDVDTLSPAELRVFLKDIHKDVVSCKETLTGS